MVALVTKLNIDQPQWSGVAFNDFERKVGGVLNPVALSLVKEKLYTPKKVLELMKKNPFLPSPIAHALVFSSTDLFFLNFTRKFHERADRKVSAPLRKVESIYS